METFNIVLEGYWREKNKTGIPVYPGLFIVYETKFNADTNTVTLIRLLYIGEAENLNNRILKHPKLDEWSKNIAAGNELSYSVARVETNNRTRIKAALIYKFRPMLNIDFKDSFLYDATMILLSGKTNLLSPHFTV